MAVSILVPREQPKRADLMHKRVYKWRRDGGHTETVNEHIKTLNPCIDERAAQSRETPQVRISETHILMSVEQTSYRAARNEKKILYPDGDSQHWPHVCADGTSVKRDETTFESLLINSTTDGDRHGLPLKCFVMISSVSSPWKPWNYQPKPHAEIFREKHKYKCICWYHHF